MAVIPPELLQAVSANGGGQLALVIGAGCSIESPTEVPLAGALARIVQNKLELDGVIAAGAFDQIGNLAALATFVYQETGSQSAVVSRFPTDKFNYARPNPGHFFLVALLSERAVTYVLSLNYDLAIQHAAAQLGVDLQVVAGPGQPVPARPTLIHLHGNIQSDPESIVLREEVMDQAWRGSWEEVVAHQILSAPSILFVGLGSAAPVLTESIDMISGAIGGAHKSIFQADVGEHAANHFSQELGITADHYIKGAWSEVLRDLSHRVLREQVDRLSARGTAVHMGNQVDPADIAGFTALVQRLNDVSLLTMGKLRAYADLDSRVLYMPRSDHTDDLLAEPMLALSKFCNDQGLSAAPLSAGVWMLSRGSARVGTILLATGGGARRLTALEHKITHVCNCIGEMPVEQPDVVLVGGTLPTPIDLGLTDILGSVPANDIVDGPGGPVTIELNDPQFMQKMTERLNAA